MPFLSHDKAVELKRQLGDNAEVLTFGSEGYAESLRRWSDTCEKEAGAVVRPTSTHQVATIVSFARRTHVPFVIKVGGHSTDAASSTHGGIVIDLSKMCKVVVDPASKTVAVQGGATWRDVDTATARYSLAIVGGTLDLSGVAGTTLGGGYGWLTGRYGLAIDNLLSARIVLADGNVIVASETEKPDLFWAIRGAGPAFGVVTELVFQAHDQRSPVYGGLLIFSAERLREVVEFANTFGTSSTKDQGLYLGFTCVPPERKAAIFAILFYNGSIKEAERLFSPLLCLGPIVNETDMMPYERLNSIIERFTSSTGRKSMGGIDITLPLEFQAVHHLFEQFETILKTNRRVEESTLTFQLLPYAEVAKVPVESTACANRGHAYNACVVFCWHDPDQDTKMHNLLHSFLAEVEACGGIRDYEIHHQGIGIAYANFAGKEVPLVDIFGANLPRLQLLKTKYDPDNVFKKWHNLRR
ncbi:FAD-binding domain-containing protein [Penicillium samsonianum]|uniref:FAD-binding domain-containing protein n=1 Tax=Penicillium samsonianum TaxID=1882272 RepID=UPI002548D99E|nr:FAD-binding domain-containing protein [Penicillium samsonianum]KAJ6140012.1 FAD-binding domain-containing protein [Penicillium samsonianum]